MDIYQVGGSVRDLLLNKPIHDRDFVVVGADVEEMLNLGFIQVGKNFPVFLHPETKEEYALARRDICIGNKHTDFICDIKDITLEEDLIRRDLTVNSLALDKNGNVIDLFNGIQDLENKLLRHISNHFIEDPLRVLRVGRFAATLDFEIAPETIELCKSIDITKLPKERIVNEVKKAFSENANSVRFIKFLEEIRKIDYIFPNIYGLGYSQEYPKYHTEPNTYEHVLNTLNLARKEPYLIKLACLYHDIGKYDFISGFNKRGHTSPEHIDKYLFPLQDSLLLSKQDYRKIRNTAIYHKDVRELEKETFTNNFINSGDYEFCCIVSKYDKLTHKI